MSVDGSAARSTFSISCISMPKLSVVVFTCRPGGIDVLLKSLQFQTFRDFELVLVDALYSRRHELVADMFGAAGIPLIHTPPRTREFPYDAIPPACNAAIVKAMSPVLLCMTDYTWVPPKALEIHW